MGSDILKAQLSEMAFHRMDDVMRSALSDLVSVGFACVHGLISPAVVSELRSEALRRKKTAQAVSSTAGHGYRAHLSGLGDAGRAFLAGSTMTELVGALFQAPLAPDKVASCYTYYQPGDFLGAHVDHAEQCPVTAILYLDVVRPEKEADRTGLALHVFDNAPSVEHRKLRAVLPTQAGALVLGLGSVNWHERPMLQDGEYLVALTACYSTPSSA